MQNNRHWKTSLLTGLLMLLTAGATLAQQMNYQGRLTDASGNAVSDAQYSITFDIYDSATGGTKLWGPQVIPADTVQGRFNVVIGPTDPSSRNIINAFNGGEPRYLQITHLGNPILPRQQILAAPVAFRAMISDTVTNGAIGNAQIADGSITAAKINGGTGVWVGNGADIYHLNGNVGIGMSNPANKLDVAGNASITGNETVSGTANIDGTVVIGSGSSALGVNHFAYSDVTLTLQSRPSEDYFLYFLNSSAANKFSVANDGSVSASGGVRAQGLFRSGSETTGETPSPAGLVIRHVNSSTYTAGTIVARTDNLTLERDGTGNGWLVRYPANPGNLVVIAKRIFTVRSGSSVTIYPDTIYIPINNPSTAGTVTVFANPASSPYYYGLSFDLTFGNPNYGQMTQVSLSRWSDELYLGSVSSTWAGTVTSTYNQ